MEQRWKCRLSAVAADGTVTGSWVVQGEGCPDLSAIDCLARYALAATRRGERLIVDEVPSELEELLALAALPIEVKRRAERRGERA